MEACPGPMRPRERIIKTARELFRRHGMRGVGVDAIAEQAGTNKMTLYRHFGSKDELIVACLRDVAAENEEIWSDLEAAHPGDPMAQFMPGCAKAPNARWAIRAVATWPMPRSNWPKPTTRPVT